MLKSRPGASCVAAALLALGCAIANSGVLAAPAAPAGDHSAEDYKSVEAVCTRCHGAAMFLNKPRTWNRWNEVFMRMTAHGARPTEVQVDHIVRYFLANLTYVNVNSAPADEISLALGVSDAVASDIIVRRQKRRFHSLADLGSVHGVDRVILQQRKSRIQF